MIYDLPTSVVLDGADYEIRSDFRAILDICVLLNDPELTDGDKAQAILEIFYPAFEEMPSSCYQEAIQKCFWFINCGTEPQKKKQPKLLDWEQDFQLICAPVNRVVGKEIRALEYLHWWTFMLAYNEIGGDCTFAQVVRIREKKTRGKSLDKQDREWYRRNRELVDFKTHYTDDENDLMKEWAGK